MLTEGAHNGFLPDIGTLERACAHPRRKSLFFTATMSAPVRARAAPTAVDEAEEAFVYEAKTSLKEVKSKLAALGLSLGMSVEEYV